MNRLLEMLWILIRIAIFWFAVYGFGSVLLKYLRRYSFRIPVSFAGIVFLLFLSIPLSAVGILNRLSLTVILLAGALTGIYILVRRKSSEGWLDKKGAVVTSILVLITLLFVISNAMRASIPRTNPDALVTYAVQPDRWLESGRIDYLQECKFSGLPVSGEILAAWPAALSSSRTDQLSILQIFQMSMLLLSCITAWRILGGGRNGLLIIVMACMAVPMLSGWATLPKIEMTVLYFSTMALALVYRKLRSGERTFDPVPFLAMGLAMGTKLTAFVLLPSFLLIALAIKVYRKPGNVIIWLAVLCSVPLIFAVRTFVNTGSPFYPFSISIFQPDDEHLLVEIPEIEELARQNVAPNDLLGNRDPLSLPVNISRLVISWGLPALLFLIGIGSMIQRKKLSDVLFPLTAVLIYIILASMAFNPIWWGAKYAFLMSPFLAAVGVRWSEGLTIPRVSLYAFLLVLILSSSFLPRFTYLFSFPRNSSSLGFRPPNVVLVKALHDWCNENLPENSTLLSMWKRERYFSDHTVMIIENHPLGRRIIVAETLEDEMFLLREMGVDYIYFQSSDPMPGDLENMVRVLASDRLEYVIEISGFTLCRIIY